MSLSEAIAFNSHEANLLTVFPTFTLLPVHLLNSFSSPIFSAPFTEVGRYVDAKLFQPDCRSSA